MTNPKSKAAALRMGGKQPAQTGKAFMVILGVLMAFTSLSTDIYLPAMPVMADELHGNAELTVTGFLVGFAIAQLVWGPVSDRIGLLYAAVYRHGVVCDWFDRLRNVANHGAGGVLAGVSGFGCLHRPDVGQGDDS